MSIYWYLCILIDISTYELIVINLIVISYTLLVNCVVASGQYYKIELL